MRALILAPFNERQLDRLRAVMDVDYESWLDTRRIHDPDELAARIAAEGISVLILEADFLFDDTFEAAVGLRFVGICRASTHQVEIDAATEHGVVVVNTPGRNARAVAEHVVGLMFALARRIPAGHRFVVGREWQSPVDAYLNMRGVELGGRTLGIIGLGAIGRELAGLAVGLGMDVVAYDPYATDAPAGVTITDLDTVASTSDFVSIHIPSTSETTGLVDAGFLARMKPTAFLVNCSDARIVETDAIVDALREQRIDGAAFDVFDTEPIAPDHPFLELTNVILTPHLGGATDETVERHSEMMVDDVLAFVEGRRPANVVNPDVFERRGR